MKDAVYEKFVHRWEQTTELPTQTMGPFTPYYKMVTKRLKVFPWPVLFLAGIVLVAALYILFGPGIAPITSLLQRGF